MTPARLAAAHFLGADGEVGDDLVLLVEAQRIAGAGTERVAVLGQSRRAAAPAIAEPAFARITGVVGATTSTIGAPQSLLLPPMKPPGVGCTNP